MFLGKNWKYFLVAFWFEILRKNVCLVNSRRHKRRRRVEKRGIAAPLLVYLYQFASEQAVLVAVGVHHLGRLEIQTHIFSHKTTDMSLSGLAV